MSALIVFAETAKKCIQLETEYFAKDLPVNSCKLESKRWQARNTIDWP